MNASPNLTDPYDPMAGTLAGTGRITYSPDFQSEKSATARVLQAHSPATPHESLPQPFGGRTRMQCQARGCDGCLVCVPDSFARAQGEIANSRNSSSSTSGVNVNILALDLGTKLGWAVRARDGAVWHGTEVFTPRKSWTPGQRWLRARSFVTDLVVRHQVHAIAYEDVKRHVGTDAAHAYGAFLCLVQMVADSHRAALMPVGVGTIKKHWTGKGNADKAAMEAQARARGFRPESDNDADALAILHWAVAQERKA
ncbi:hypothetical protein [Achromobacter sp. 413638]|uniref:hypothetical protein n=1 Tax=Achromobacter sp. 413638 TaxID=3342385 RepID=UPI00370B6E70